MLKALDFIPKKTKNNKLKKKPLKKSTNWHKNKYPVPRIPYRLLVIHIKLYNHLRIVGTLKTENLLLNLNTKIYW
jgi:hypothetical protein